MSESLKLFKNDFVQFTYCSVPDFAFIAFRFSEFAAVRDFFFFCVLLSSSENIPLGVQMKVKGFHVNRTCKQYVPYRLESVTCVTNYDIFEKDDLTETLNKGKTLNSHLLIIEMT